MKNILRIYLFHLFALLVVTELLKPGFSIGGGTQNFLLAALVISLLNVLLKPLLKILFLPITALTVGLFSFIIIIGVFYVFTRLVPEITIQTWNFPGYQLFGFEIVGFEMSMHLTLAIAALLVSLITNFLFFLIK